jgi:hypothetical protein
MTQLFAPAEYWALDPQQRADVCNGCGTKGLCGYVIPDTIWGLCITPACNIHDYMYEAGWYIEDKEEADRVFLNNMLRIIDAETRFDWLKRLRSRRARVYYEAVRLFGGPAFWAGKNKEDEMPLSSL